MEDNERGFIQIPRELGNRLKKMSSVTRAEWRVLLHLFDKITSYGKLEDRISAGQIAKATGLSLKWVKIILSNLEAKKMIAIRRELGRGHQNEPNMIRFQNPDLWVGEEISNRYRKQLEQRKNLYRKSKQKGVTSNTLSEKAEEGGEGKAQEVGKEISKGGEGNPRIDEQRIYKEINKEVMSEPQNPGSDVFSPSSFNENQNKKSKDPEPSIEPRKEEEKSITEGWPPFLQEQAKAREERDQKRKLSSGSLRKEGLSDEEIRIAFNGKISPEEYRQLVKGKAHDEVLKIQVNLMT